MHQNAALCGNGLRRLTVHPLVQFDDLFHIFQFVGFGAPVASDNTQTPITDISDLFSKPSEEEETKAMDEAFRDVQEVDIIKYGFLPEFVGRMSKFVVTHSLDEEALRQILTEPKNALVKQYQYIFGFEKVLAL